MNYGNVSVQKAFRNSLHKHNVKLVAKTSDNLRNTARRGFRIDRTAQQTSDVPLPELSSAAP